MKRALLAAIAAVLVGVPAASAASPTISVRVEPSSPRFGDTFAYVVTATVDASQVGSARITAAVAPFTRLGPAVETRSTANGIGQIMRTESLACFSTACLGRPLGAAVAIPRADVSAAGEVATTAPATVAVRHRVRAADVKAATPAFRRPTTLPAMGYRVSPSVATALLALLGVALIALGVVVLSAPLRRSRAARGQTFEADQRQRAVRLLRESATRDASDRRRAASLASRVVDEPELASTAAGVAWSRPGPESPDARMLADRVEHPAGVGG